MSQKNIYLIVSQAEYMQAIEKGQLVKESLGSEGFIHASDLPNLTRVANKFYLSCELPMVLEVAVEEIEAEVKWEAAANSLYPHIYGPLNMSAVVNVHAIVKEDTGLFALSYLADK